MCILTMRHAEIPENLSVLGIFSVKYPLSLTISVYKFIIMSCALLLKARVAICAYNIGTTTTMPHLNERV